MNFNQMINFLDPIFDTKVNCSCIVDDLHGVENLIANDVQLQNRGFMAYHVVKPPVELEFQLCCTIELATIKIWPQIDSLKSTGFEVYIQCDNIDYEYRKVANHFNLQEFGIQFINDATNLNDKREMNFAVIPFFPSTKNQRRRVQNVKLIIKQTAKCVPVIKRIEIWGVVSKVATQVQKDYVYQTIERTTESIECSTSKLQHEIVDCKSSIDELLHTQSNIPETFLDAITFEVMALPMVLPSGKIIDSSTLQKHNEHEEKWGRVPSDPFTFQPFTDTRKPILDVYLKSQIDSFLLKNCNVPEISELPRTVGTILKRPIQSIDGCNGSDSKLAKIENTANNRYSSIGNSISSQSSITTFSSSSPSSSSSSSSSSSTIPHRNNKSLDDAIRGVLTVGKYTAISSRNQSESDLYKCYQCSQTNCHTFYIITTCSHFICRPCLVISNLSICKCGKSFRNIDVNKCHRRGFLYQK